MDVGFVGLGHMGAPMARNLLKAGHRVTVYKRTRGKAQALAEQGAQLAERVAVPRRRPHHKVLEIVTGRAAQAQFQSIPKVSALLGMQFGHVPPGSGSAGHRNGGEEAKED